MLGRVVKLPHALRLTIVCLVLAGLLSGVVFLGGATIAQQATVLSDTIKSQLVNVKAFLERNGIDTSYFDLGNPDARRLVDTGNAWRGAGAQSSQRRRDRLQRRRDRQPDAETAARHGERRRKFLHRAVSRTGLRRAAERLPQRAVVHGPGAASRPRHRHRRPHRRNAGALADRADPHHGRGVLRHLDRACRSSASRARSFWASRPDCSPSFRRSARWSPA